MRIAALDPGGTTGWTIFDVEINYGCPVWKKRLWEHFDHGQMGGTFEHHKLLWLFLQSRRPDLVIGEQFVNRGNEWADISARDYVGIIKLYGQMANVPIVWQSAGQAKAFATDEKLEMLGLLALPATKWKHANDAMRHMIRWICCDSASTCPMLKNPFLLKLHELAEP
jgi:hypothetical protein